MDEKEESAPAINFFDIMRAYKWKGPGYDGKLPKLEIRYDDIFHLKNLYKLIHEYLVDKGFTALHGGKDMYEDYYLERHTGNVVEYWFYWYSQKPKNAYYRYKINVTFHCIAMSKVKIKYKGRELGMNKGEVQIMLNAEVETDYDKKWSKHPLLKHFKKGYDRLIFYNEFKKQHAGDLMSKVSKLHSLIKGYLNIRTAAPPEMMLHPVAEGTEGRWPVLE